VLTGDPEAQTLAFPCAPEWDAPAAAVGPE